MEETGKHGTVVFPRRTFHRQLFHRLPVSSPIIIFSIKGAFVAAMFSSPIHNNLSGASLAFQPLKGKANLCLTEMLEKELS
jgi:hypothetical protein